VTGPGRPPSIVLGPTQEPATLTVSFSDIEGGPNAIQIVPGTSTYTIDWQEGNIDEPPGFFGAASGAWTVDGVLDANTAQMTLTDATACWSDGELAGRLVRPNADQPEELVVISNTRTSLTAWADFRVMADPNAVARAGSSYEILEYHLTAASPCRNAGDPNGDYTGQTDIDGEPRVMGGRVDMGADEYKYGTWKCGSGPGAMLPLVAVSLYLSAALRRR
jgi:hypothetical protein